MPPPHPEVSAPPPLPVAGPTAVGVGLFPGAISTVAAPPVFRPIGACLSGLSRCTTQASKATVSTRGLGSRCHEASREHGFFPAVTTGDWHLARLPEQLLDRRSRAASIAVEREREREREKGGRGPLRQLPAGDRNRAQESGETHVSVVCVGPDQPNQLQFPRRAPVLCTVYPVELHTYPGPSIWFRLPVVEASGRFPHKTMVVRFPAPRCCPPVCPALPALPARLSLINRPMWPLPQPDFPDAPAADMLKRPCRFSSERGSGRSGGREACASLERMLPVLQGVGAKVRDACVLSHPIGSERVWCDAHPRVSKSLPDLQRGRVCVCACVCVCVCVRVCAVVG